MPPTSLGAADPPSASTRWNLSPSRRRLTPSPRPVMTRSPYGAEALDQAKLREGPAGSACGSDSLQPGKCSSGSHQARWTSPPSASPVGLKNNVSGAPISVRSPSIHTPWLVTVRICALEWGAPVPVPGAENGSPSSVRGAGVTSAQWPSWRWNSATSRELTESCASSQALPGELSAIASTRKPPPSSAVAAGTSIGSAAHSSPL